MHKHVKRTRARTRMCGIAFVFNKVRCRLAKGQRTGNWVVVLVDVAKLARAATKPYSRAIQSRSSTSSNSQQSSGKSSSPSTLTERYREEDEALKSGRIGGEFAMITDQLCA